MKCICSFQKGVQIAISTRKAREHTGEWWSQGDMWEGSCSIHLHISGIQLRYKYSTQSGTWRKEQECFWQRVAGGKSLRQGHACQSCWGWSVRWRRNSLWQVLMMLKWRNNSGRKRGFGVGIKRPLVHWRIQPAMWKALAWLFLESSVLDC